MKAIDKNNAFLLFLELLAIPTMGLSMASHLVFLFFYCKKESSYYDESIFSIKIFIYSLAPLLLYPFISFEWISLFMMIGLITFYSYLGVKIFNLFNYAEAK